MPPIRRTSPIALFTTVPNISTDGRDKSRSIRWPQSGQDLVIRRKYGRPPVPKDSHEAYDQEGKIPVNRGEITVLELAPSVSTVKAPYEVPSTYCSLMSSNIAEVVDNQVVEWQIISSVPTRQQASCQQPAAP